MRKRKLPDAGILSAALEGLEIRKQRLDQQIAEVRRVLGGRGQKSALMVEARKPRRKLSTAARERIAAAQRERWAEYRKQKAARAKK
jgi:hypothetical protein